MHRHVHKFIVPFNEAAPLNIIGICFCPFILTGLALYYANFIQLGLDELMEASSMHLSLFIHWVIWIETLRTAVLVVCAGFIGCENNYNNYHTKVAILSIPCLVLFSFPFVLAFSCWKCRWFIANPAQHNPYKTVFKVLNFARTHKWPLRRSTFTYCDDEKPSRVDYAKERYGGPFITEQVEDVKAFLRILGLLLTLGPPFIMDNLSSFMAFTAFGLHTGYLADFRHHCSRWAILDSGALKYLIGAILVPFFILVHFLFLKQRIKVFTRIGIGLFLYFLGLVSMLIIDLAGHLHSVNDQGVGSHCMFTYSKTDDLIYPVLELHWTVLLPPNILLGIGSPIVVITVLEFISAQSPQSMKGLLIGVFFVIQGLFQLIGSLLFLLFSTNSIYMG